jgi:hypothetical protein
VPVTLICLNSSGHLSQFFMLSFAQPGHKRATFSSKNFYIRARTGTHIYNLDACNLNAVPFVSETTFFFKRREICTLGVCQLVWLPGRAAIRGKAPGGNGRYATGGTLMPSRCTTLYSFEAKKSSRNGNLCLLSKM